LWCETCWCVRYAKLLIIMCSLITKGRHNVKALLVLFVYKSCVSYLVFTVILCVSLCNLLNKQIDRLIDRSIRNVTTSIMTSINQQVYPW